MTDKEGQKMVRAKRLMAGVVLCTALAGGVAPAYGAGEAGTTGPKAKMPRMMPVGAVSLVVRRDDGTATHGAVDLRPGVRVLERDIYEVRRAEEVVGYLCVGDFWATRYPSERARLHWRAGTVRGLLSEEEGQRIQEGDIVVAAPGSEEALPEVARTKIQALWREYFATAGEAARSRGTAILEHIVVLNARDDFAQYYLALHYSSLKQYEKALRRFGSVRDPRTLGEDRIEFAWDWGTCAYEAGKWAEAAHRMDQAIEMWEDASRSFVDFRSADMARVAKVFRKLGDRANAARYDQKYIELRREEVAGAVGE